MTVNTTTNQVEYSGDDSTTAFAYSNYFQNTSDIVCILIDANLNQTTWVENTDYTVSGTTTNDVYVNGGTITATTAPATGETLRIYADPDLTQGVDLTSNGQIPAETLEQAYDKLTVLCQRLDQRLDDSNDVPRWVLHSTKDLTNGGANDLTSVEWTNLPSDTSAVRVLVNQASPTADDEMYVNIGSASAWGSNDFGFGEILAADSFSKTSGDALKIDATHDWLTNAASGGSGVLEALGAVITRARLKLTLGATFDAGTATLWYYGSDT